MKISKTVSINLADLAKIQEKIEKGEYKSVSEFVQFAIKNQLGDNNV